MIVGTFQILIPFVLEKSLYQVFSHITGLIRFYITVVKLDNSMSLMICNMVHFDFSMFASLDIFFLFGNLYSRKDIIVRNCWSLFAVSC